jgi:hypothetical protein
MAKKTAKGKARAVRRKAPSITDSTVFQHLKLNSVRLVTLDAKLDIKDGKVPVHAKIQALPKCGPTADGKKMLAILEVEIVGRPEGAGDDDDCSTVRIKANYQCVYEIVGVKADDIAPHAVAVANTGMLVIWPYLRELANSISTKMAIPPIVLPMFVPAQASLEVWEDLANQLKSSK